MKKIYLLSTAIVFTGLTVMGQNDEATYSTISPKLKNIIQAVEDYDGNISQSPIIRYSRYSESIQTVDSKVSLLVKARGDFEAELATLGLRADNVFGDIYSLRVSVSILGKVSTLSGVMRIEEAPKPSIKLKNALASTNVSSVHAGTNLKSSYNGKGVVVGIIDVGIDMTHPMFYNAAGTDTRISRVWVTSDNNGTPPAGYTYGTELKTTSEMQTYKTSNNSASHGTHVSGIAAGSAYGSPDYLGVANNAEIVFVETGDNTADELAYVFKYANSVSKPAVVNMSLGSHRGPHDGSSLLDQAIDNLAKEGQIIVGSAGNEGGTALHLKHSFSGDTIYTIPELDDGTTYVDMWGEKNKHFSINIQIADVVNDNVVFETDYFSTSLNDVDDTIISQGSDQISLEFGGELSSLNQKSHAMLSIQSNTNAYATFISITASSGTVHAWNDGTGNGVPFSNDFGSGAEPDFVAGDVNSTMGEIGGTAKDIISVGSYTSTTTYTSLLTGQVTNTTEAKGAIAEYSSKGPTVDGRVAPVITAPGNYVISSVNSYDANYGPSGNSEDDVTDSIMDGSDYWYYGAMSGTSMAAPMTTGIIALLLEKNPKLSPDEVKVLLKNHAIKDSHTGTVPSSGSNTWGFGKIDALAMMKKLEEEKGPPASVVEIEESSRLLVYPNPTENNLIVKSVEMIKQISIISLDGKVQLVENPNQLKIQLDVAGLNNGVYLLKVQSEQEIQVLRIMKR